MSVTLDGVLGLDNAQLVVTFNYSAVANTCTFQSLGHSDWCSQSVVISTRRLLVTAYNNGYFSASVLKSAPRIYTLQISQ
jgi:hypothetical protein